MRIITEPSVYLIGKSAVNDAELDRFLADNDLSSWQTDTEVGGEKLVEVAGRLCYMSFAKPRPGGNKAYINHILEVGHGSVAEHSVFTLLLTGVSRSLTHELVRHRAGMGYSQLSQRFVDESDCEFVLPPLLLECLAAYGLWEKQNRCRSVEEFKAIEQEGVERFGGEDAFHLNAEIAREFRDAVGYVHASYARLVAMIEKLPAVASLTDATARRKAAREAARSVLPNATETKITVTGNARALRHFIEMRGDIAADAEIRRLAVAVLKLLRADSPNLFGDYLLDRINGQECTTTPYAKV